MRYQILAAWLLFAVPVLSSPTPSRDDDDDCDGRVRSGESIQKAIDNAKRGDKIIVEKGTYKEQLTITKDGIRLIGRGAILMPPSPSNTKSFCYGLSHNYPLKPEESLDTGICIYDKDTVLDDYKPENQHRKIKSIRDFIKNVVVTGFEVKDFKGINIAVVGGKDTKIYNNQMVNGGQYGFLTVGSQETLAQNNVVRADAGGFIGMCMDDRADAKFKENKVSDYFIALCGQTPGGLMKQNKVSNCCIGPFIDPGVKGMKVIENTITDKNKAICTLPEDQGGEAGAGIVISGGQNTLVRGNTIKRINNNNGKGVGIFVEDNSQTGIPAKDNTFKDNYLEKNDFDIYVLSNATGNVFKGNKCTTSATAADPNKRLCDN